MRPLVVIRSYPQGPRLWVAGQRVHHGATGALIVAAAVAAKRRPLAAVAALLCLHDRHDWRAWFAREGLAGITLDTDAPVL